MSTYRFSAELWRSPGDSGWCFVTLPHDVTDDIDERTADRRTGFGSVRVRATVGSTTWATSVFPDSGQASFVLPVKRPVRDAEHLGVGDVVTVHLVVVHS